MGETKKSSNAADEDEFHGKRILVTGGTRGIGAAIVDRLTAGGGQVITTGRSLRSGTSRDGFVQADISTADGLAEIVRAVTERLGGIDMHGVSGMPRAGLSLFGMGKRPVDTQTNHYNCRETDAHVEPSCSGASRPAECNTSLQRYLFAMLGV
jgi:NAD(P)-dependent dehydrogenase (short-subunit alcohol dehydrogenase family)